jgi:siroheme synthase-like protein
MRDLLIAALDLRDKPCVIIGGGGVASRKAKKLVKCGAKLKVIAPVSTKELDEMALKGVISLEDRCYRKGDLSGAFLAVIATDNDTVNMKALEEAEGLKILANAAFDKNFGNIFFTATKDFGDFVLSAITKDFTRKKGKDFLDMILEKLDIIKRKGGK